MGDRTVLAHLSDVHLGPLPALGWRHFNVKRGLGALNWRRSRQHVHAREVADRLVADLKQQHAGPIAVTGDLVNIGLPEEHAEAARWLETVGAAERVCVVPGNHDIYVRLASDPGTRRWARYMTSDAWGQGLTLAQREGFPYVRRTGNVAVIGVNSAVPTPPFIAGGRIGREQLAGLAAALRAAREAGLVRVILIHHPPLVRQGDWRRGLADARALELVLDTEGAELILHGHNHRDTVISRALACGGHVRVVGIASASARRSHHGDPLARYNLIEISGEVGAPSIALVGRGLMQPDGAVVALGRQDLGRAFGGTSAH